MMNPSGPKVKHIGQARWIPARAATAAQEPSPVVWRPSTSHWPPTFAMVTVTWLL